MNPQNHIIAIYYKYTFLQFGMMLSNIHGLTCYSQLIKRHTQLCST